MWDGETVYCRWGRYQEYNVNVVISLCVLSKQLETWSLHLYTYYISGFCISGPFIIDTKSWYTVVKWHTVVMFCHSWWMFVCVWGCGIRVQAEPLVQPALGYHITNSKSRYITPTRLQSAQYSLHNNAPSSRKLLKMDVLTSETCWAINLHNKASVIKVGVPLFKYQDDAWSNMHKIHHKATFPYQIRKWDILWHFSTCPCLLQFRVI